MVYLPHLPVALLLQAALCLVASAAKNYSIDDQNPLFKYSGPWQRITHNVNTTTLENLDKDGGHMMTDNSSASATISYTCAYFLKVNPMIIKSFQTIPFPLSFFSFFPFFILEWNRWTNEHLFTVASVYFLACLWSYPVASNYAIDWNKPMRIYAGPFTQC